MRNWWVYVLVMILVACGGGDDGPPPPPQGAVLLFPEKDTECTTGTDTGNNKSQVTFRWQTAKNTDRYTLTVINLTTNVPQAIATAANSAVLTIEKGAPFSWSVLSTNSDTDETATSESWLFYNAGAQTTHAPFPAQIVSPIAGGTVQASTENQVTLSWTGADVENDITGYTVYFATENPPETLLGNTTADEQQTTANVDSGLVYYWRVVTTDTEGHTSDSGVFSFKVL